jgi:hypothetical protein
MLRTASYITLGISALFLAANVPSVSANSSVSVSNNGEDVKTNVHVQTNTGGNTICQNGKCTTTSSSNNGKSTVCVNGVCNTSEDGDVNYQSENGNTKVNIQTNGEANGDQGVVTKKGVPTITPTLFKDVNQEVKGAKTKAEDIKKQVKEKVEKEKEKGFNLLNFLEAEIEGIKNIFSFWK